MASQLSHLPRVGPSPGQHRTTQRWLRIVLTLVTLCATPSANATPTPEVLWLARTDGGTTMLMQVHPTGHAWIRFNSHLFGGRQLGTLGVLEVAVQLEPRWYPRLREVVDKIGIKPGSYADLLSEGNYIGIAPVTAGPKYRLDDGTFSRAIAAFEDAVRSSGAKPRAAWDELMSELRRTGQDCLIEPEGKTTATLQRSVGKGLILQDQPESSCLLSSSVKEILARNWSPTVEQVYFEATLRTGKSNIDIVFDADAPLSVNGRELGPAIGLNPVEPSTRQTVHLKGTWKAGFFRFHPSSAGPGYDAVAAVRPETLLRFPKALWRDDIQVSLRVERASERPSGSSIRAHGERITHCEGSRECAELSMERLRGLAAAAYGQCEYLAALGTPVSREAGARRLRIGIGKNTCQVSIPSAYVNSGHTGLIDLFYRLSDRSEFAKEMRFGVLWEFIHPADSATSQ